MAKRDTILGCPTFDPADTWLGMDYFDAHGLVDTGARCMPHCNPCALDDSGVKPQVGDAGNRWLRPDPDRPSRDAYGMFHALRSAEPHLYPKYANFRRGSCYNNNGEECDGKVCHCDPQHEADWDGPGCRDGTIEGQIRTSYFADMTFTTGNHFGTGGDWLDCRTERPPQLFDLPVRIRRGPNNQMGTARSNYCTSNLLVLCIGKRHHNACTWVGGQYPWGNEYFNENPRRDSDWRIMYVHDLSPQLVNGNRHPQNIDVANAVLDAKNAALEFASDPTNLPGEGPHAYPFQQMQHVNFDAPNGTLGHWRSDWSTEHIVGAPVYLTLPNCRLRFSGLPVLAELVVLSGYIDLDLVLHRVVHVDDPSGVNHGATPQLWASPRFRMHLELGVRAYFTGESAVTLHDGTPMPLAIHNPTHESRRYPLLFPRGYDNIVYIDNGGREFTPPTEVDWNGSRQHEDFTSGGGVWPDLFAGRDEPTGAIHVYCHEIAKLLNEQNKLTVKGTPDVYTEDDKIQHYGGSVVVHLTTD